MQINDFLLCCRRVRFGMNVTRPRVLCADGYTVSVQAGRGMYSTPREDADSYTRVELGYPSAQDAELIPYAENPDAPLDTVYAYVPVEIVDAVLEKHGGITGADFSNGTAAEWSAVDDVGGVTPDGG